MILLTALIEMKRKKMIATADYLGLNAPETLKLSQELDHLINIFQIANDCFPGNFQKPKSVRKDLIF